MDFFEYYRKEVLAISVMNLMATILIFSKIDDKIIF
jgi:hypothetical protein